MHALDCFLEQLATQSETDAERKVYSRKRRSWSRESESERVKSPFRCNDFLGEEQTHGRILFVRVSRAYIYIHELWHRDEDGNAYTPGGGVPFLFAVSSEKETKRERERERESLSMAAKKKKKKKKTNDDKETKKEEEEKTKIKRHKSTTLVRGTATFDNNKRVDFVTGFRKRKNTRRKKAATEFEKKLKEERREAKMNKRRTFREMLGLKADDDQEEEEEEKKEEKKREEKAYASGVSVVIEGL